MLTSRFLSSIKYLNQTRRLFSHGFKHRSEKRAQKIIHDEAHKLPTPFPFWEEYLEEMYPRQAELKAALKRINRIEVSQGNEVGLPSYKKIPICTHNDNVEQTLEKAQAAHTVITSQNLNPVEMNLRNYQILKTLEAALRAYNQIIVREHNCEWAPDASTQGQINKMKEGLEAEIQLFLKTALQGKIEEDDYQATFIVNTVCSLLSPLALPQLRKWGLVQHKTAGSAVKFKETFSGITCGESLVHSNLEETYPSRLGGTVICHGLMWGKDRIIKQVFAGGQIIYSDFHPGFLCFTDEGTPYCTKELAKELESEGLKLGTGDRWEGNRWRVIPHGPGTLHLKDGTVIDDDWDMGSVNSHC